MINIISNSIVFEDLPALIVDLITANLACWRRVSEASKRVFATIKSKLMPAKFNVLKRIYV
jgi:hypothetical protein